MSNTKTIFTNIKKYLCESENKIKKSPRKQFVFFILAFVLAYLVLTGIMIPFENDFKVFTGNVSQSLLGAQGISTTTIGLVEFDIESAFSFNINSTNQTVVISWLCTGILEIIILISAILASFGVTWKKKGIGIIIAIVSGLVFNFVRILITLNIIIFSGAGVFELAHDLLFRIVLFLYIMIVYVLWFMWSDGRLNLKKILKFK